MSGGDRSRVLVTGGAGFIGRRAVRALNARGDHRHLSRQALGYQPRMDLKAGIATVWPEFSEKAK